MIGRTLDKINADLRQVKDQEQMISRQRLAHLDVESLVAMVKTYLEKPYPLAPNNCVSNEFENFKQFPT